MMHKKYILTLLAIISIAGYILSLAGGAVRIACVLLFTAVLVRLSVKSGVTAAEMGLSKSSLNSGLAWGFGSLAVIGAAIVIAVSIRPDLFMDERYQQSLGTAVFQGLVFIPLATVFFEEYVFRGLLPALLLRHYHIKKAILLSSLCFGLWHIFSSSGFSSAFFGDDSVVFKIFGLLIVFAATFSAGILLSLLRIRSGSIVAPILAHWGINSFALLAAAVAWKS